MILWSGNRKSLAGAPWAMFEVRTEECIDEVIFRIGSALPSIYADLPVEVFISIDGAVRMRLPYLFARSSTPKASLRIRRVDGIELVLPHNADEEVQIMIEQDRQEFSKRQADIECGCFVRVRSGPVQGYCGTVIKRENGTARIEVRTITKRLYLSTPASNLQVLENLPSEIRKFYPVEEP